MESNHFPMDSIWLDGDHTDSYRWFRWNQKTFQKPLEMFTKIAQYKKVAVSISDPHFKIDMNYTVYNGAKGKYFVKWKNGSDYEGYNLMYYIYDDTLFFLFFRSLLARPL